MCKKISLHARVHKDRASRYIGWRGCIYRVISFSSADGGRVVFWFAFTKFFSFAWRAWERAESELPKTFPRTWQPQPLPQPPRHARLPWPRDNAHRLFFSKDCLLDCSLWRACTLVWFSAVRCGLQGPRYQPRDPGVWRARDQPLSPKHHSQHFRHKLQKYMNN